MKAVYPGSFDPITLGHLDLIERALSFCGTLIVLCAVAGGKTPLFSPEERVDLIRASLKERGLSDSCRVESFRGLLADYVNQNDIRLIIRGLRVLSDFEYEFQMAQVNRQLAPSVQTIFIPTDLQKSFVSSSAVKEVASYGRDVSAFVTPAVSQALFQRLRPPV